MILNKYDISVGIDENIYKIRQGIAATRLR